MTSALSSLGILRIRPPFHRAALLSYLSARAMPGVEQVDGDVYRRVVTQNGRTGILSVDLGRSETLGQATVGCDIPGARHWAITRAEALIDGDTDVSPIEVHLRRDHKLGVIVAAQQGVRIPGAVDPFELAVRSILGQQISVAGARTLATRLVERFGTPLPVPRGNLTVSFPSAFTLEGADIEHCGVTRARAGSIRTLARLTATGQLEMAWRSRVEETYEELLRIKGIGPWTASYIALRALGAADASMATDLGVRQVIGTRRAPVSASVAAVAADRWIPFRGYAAIHIWTSLLLSQHRT